MLYEWFAQVSAIALNARDFVELTAFIALTGEGQGLRQATQADETSCLLAVSLQVTNRLRVSVDVFTEDDTNLLNSSESDSRPGPQGNNSD